MSEYKYKIGHTCRWRHPNGPNMVGIIHARRMGKREPHYGIYPWSDEDGNRIPYDGRKLALIWRPQSWIA